MYRAITSAVLATHTTYTEADVNELLPDLTVEIRYIDHIMRVFVNGEDVTGQLRGDLINKHVSVVASYKAVRAKLVDIQRSVAASMISDGYGVVVDGRDIGTVVFPGAEVKIFLSASAEVRAKRRAEELRVPGKEDSYNEILKGINERDTIDSNRAISPLRKAEDAISVDTSGLSFEEQVSRVIYIVKERQIEHDV